MKKVAPPKEEPIPEAVLPFLDWDRVLAFCEKDMHLSPELRQRQRTGIALLRDILGDDFPRWAWSQRHPQLEMFVMGGAHSRRSLAARGFALHALKGIEGYDRLLKQFLRPDRDKHSEAVAVADLARRLQDVGIEVAFEVPATDRPRARRPDLRLVLAGQGAAYVEVSLLGHSGAWRATEASTSKISNAVFFGPAGVKGCLVLETLLSARDTDHLVLEILALREKVVLSGEFRCLHRPGTVWVGLAGTKGIAELERQAEARGLQVGDGVGPNAAENIARRVIRKIRSEQEQLPTHSLGIIFVPISSITFSPGELIQELTAIEKEIGSYANLAVAIVQWTVRSWGGALPPAASVPFGTAELITEDSPRHQLLVWNTSAVDKLSTEAVVLLKKALMLKTEFERAEERHG